MAAAGASSVRVDAVSERRVTRNVVGERGRRAAGVVMLGAHLDSVPAGPGMNDNASGSAAVLAAAERLARDGVGRRPRRLLGRRGARPVRLAPLRRAASGERRGAGSRPTSTSTWSARRAAGAAVYDTDDGVERALRRGLRAAGRTPSEERPRLSSDHAAFRRAGVPVGGVFTGLDDCYHRACDRLGNVDLALVRDVTEAVTRAAKRLSQAT